MGLIALLVLVVVVVLLTGAAVWVIDYLMPGHPPIIDRGLWVVCVAIIALVLWRALGGHDVAIPKIL